MVALPRFRYSAGPQTTATLAGHLGLQVPAYQPLPLPPPDEPPPPEPLDEPGAVEEAAMAPEKLPPRLEAKPETPRWWKPRPEYQRGR